MSSLNAVYDQDLYMFIGMEIVMYVSMLSSFDRCVYLCSILLLILNLKKHEMTIAITSFIVGGNVPVKSNFRSTYSWFTAGKQCKKAKSYIYKNKIYQLLTNCDRSIILLKIIVQTGGRSK